MNIEEIREYCLQKRGVKESLPFGDDTLVFKLMGKIFLLMNLEGELRLNLKCDPERVESLREEYSCVLPGYHMNKQHWNTVIVDAAPSESVLREWIDHSYERVRSGLSNKLREELGE